MVLSLFSATLLCGLVLFALGLPFWALPQVWEKSIRAFPRSVLASYITLLSGGGWFLFKITQLTQADFGDYKNLLFALFLVTMIGSFLFVKDFLAVRGTAVLTLMLANEGLKSAYGYYEEPGRLLFVTILYVFICAAIYYGTVPFKARDHLDALYKTSLGPKVFGAVLSVLGFGCLIVAFSY